MKKAMWIALGLLCGVATESAAQSERIELYADEAGTTCQLIDSSVGFKSVYIFHNNAFGATGCYFRAEKPPCWNALFMGQHINPTFLTIGSAQTGLVVAYGACLRSPIYIGRLEYFSLGSSGPCCGYPVTAHPDYGRIVVVDCQLVEKEVIAGGPVVINPTNECPTCPPLPFADDKLELFADEGMTQCALVDNAPGIKSVHIFHTGTMPRIGSHFSVATFCWTGASWVADYVNPQFYYVGGGLQSDAFISYNECREPPFYIGRIDYYSPGSEATCCPFYVRNGGTHAQSIEVTDCSPNLLYAAQGRTVVVNPGPDCPDCSGTVSIQSTTWGRIKAMYRSR